MAFEYGVETACLHVPESYALVAASRSEELIGGVECQAEYFSLMPAERSSVDISAIGNGSYPPNKEAPNPQKPDMY